MMSGSSSYEADGFFVVRNALSPQECERFDAVLSGCSMQSRPDLGVRYARDCLSTNKDLADLVLNSPAAKGLAAHTILYDEVVETLNTSGAPYPVHQDGGCFPGAIVSLALALTALNNETWGLSVAPGSHSEGLRATEKADGGFQCAADAEHHRLDLLPLERGDMVIIHPHLLHTMVRSGISSPARMFSAVFG